MAEDENFLLLSLLVDTNNTIRSHAEEAYDKSAPETKAVYLLRAIQNAEVSEDGRQTAAVLLRRLFTADLDFFPKLPFEQQTQLREQLLLTILMDITQPLRRKVSNVCDVVSELASHRGANQWPEFLQFVITCANAQDSNMKEAGIRMFGMFASVPRVFGNLQYQNLVAIKRMLLAALQSKALRAQAVKAVGAFLLHRNEPAIKTHLRDLVEPTMRAVVKSMDIAEDDTQLKVLIELAGSAPEVLRRQLEIISQAAIKMVRDKNREDSWRQLALEVMVTLCETAPVMVRRHMRTAVRTLTPLVLEMMCEIEDHVEWAMEDKAVDDENHYNNVVAESALRRMCCGFEFDLYGDIMWEPIFWSVPVMLQAGDWRRRHAALMALSSASQGCCQQMYQTLDKLTPAVLNHLADPHPRVRYAACNAVGRMYTNLSFVSEKKFGYKVATGLFLVVDDNANPRVQARAVATLEKVCPKIDLDRLIIKLEVILTAKLKELIEHRRKHVLEQVVTTIGSIADTLEDRFIPYYDRFMPCLKYIIANATTAELKMLRGKTIECVSLIGLAVGEEKSLADASEVMDLLLKTHTEGEQLEADDPQTSFLIPAWSRIYRIMGKNFAQYLPMVMEPVMRTAAMQNLGLKDRASACRMLVCYARELKEAFAQYAEDVVKLMVPLLTVYCQGGVRTRKAAAESLPHLLECARIRGPQYIEGMWAYILPELLIAIDREPVQKVHVKLLNSLEKCIKLLGTGCLTDETMAEVLRILNKVLADHFEGDTHDDVVDVDLLGVVGVLRALLSAYRVTFFPHLDTLLPHLLALIRVHPSRPYAMRIFLSVIEFGGPACVKYKDIFLDPMLSWLWSAEAEVRRVAAYGCGVLAQFGGPQFANACARAVPRLAAIVAETDARSFGNVEATEDAIIAVAKIIKFNHSNINRDEIIRHWLTWLPVVEDKDREGALHVYSLLCELAAGGHPALDAPDAPQRVLAILAQAFLRGAVSKEESVYTQMVGLVRQIQSNANLFNSCLMHLSNEHKQALQQALSQVA